MSIATRTNEAQQVSLSHVVGALDWVTQTVELADLPQPMGPAPSRAMVQSIREIGVLTPVLLIETAGPDGSYEVIDGLRRIWAAREAGLEAIPARVAVGPASSLAVLSLITNEQRSANPVSEYWSITALAEGNLSETEIARLTGMPVQTIRKRLRIRDLVDPFFDMFALGDLTAALAEELAKLPANEQRDVYGRWRGGEKLTHALLQDVRMVRRENAVMDLLPGLDEDAGPEPIGDGRRARALVLIDRIRAELRTSDNAALVRAVDRLLGELEGELHRGAA